MVDTIIRYKCEVCGETYTKLERAQQCEKKHPTFSVGQRVVYHTGSYESEQGQLNPVWYPEDKHGKVIAVSEEGRTCLVQFMDRSRSWCGFHLLDHAD